MPASDHPQATGSDNIRMVHVQRSDGCPTLRRLSANDCVTLGPLKVVIPLFRPRVEQRDSRCTFRINCFESICFVAVAHRTRQKQIVLIVRAALCLRDDVVYFKQRTNDVLRCRAVTTAKTGGFGNSLAECRRDAFHRWTHSSGVNCWGSETSYPRCFSSTVACALTSSVSR
jgi:hypothetical protein